MIKYVIVTGDSGDLGYNICKSILNMDISYGVIGLSRSKNDNIDTLSNQFENRYFHVNFDLSETDKIKDVFNSHIKVQGKIFGLVNNSAFAYDDIITNANLDSLEYMYRVNVFSPIILSKFTIRNMILNNIKGSIIHISSVSAHTGYKGLSMYASTKGALEAFSKGMAREWGEKGIRSNCVAPGFMETKMSSSLTKEQKDRIYNRTSLKKETSIESVASTVAFLISDASSSITGQVLHVDNGTI